MWNVIKKLKIILKRSNFLKSYIKNGKAIICNLVILKSHQQKSPVSRKSINIIKIAVSNKVSFGKKDLNVSLASRMLKKSAFMYISPQNQFI